MPFLDILLTSVVVHNFHVRRSIFSPPEADPELIVDTNAVPTLPIASQRLQPIARRRPQELQGVRSIERRVSLTRPPSMQHRLSATPGDAAA